MQRPVLYEWKRPDGTVLVSSVFLDVTRPSLWPWEFRAEAVAGPVEVWLTEPGGQPRLIASTPDGAERMVVYSGERSYSVRPPNLLP